LLAAVIRDGSEILNKRRLAQTFYDRAHGNGAICCYHRRVSSAEFFE
jgi:hypothetical protein